MPQIHLQAEPGDYAPVVLLPGDRLVFVTDGVLERNAVTADVIGLVAATVDLHPREVVQEITRVVLRAVDGKRETMRPRCVSTGMAAANGTGKSTPARTSTARPHLEPIHDLHFRRDQGGSEGYAA